MLRCSPFTSRYFLCLVDTTSALFPLQLSAVYPGLAQLESEAESIAQIFEDAPSTLATVSNNGLNEAKTPGRTIRPPSHSRIIKGTTAAAAACIVPGAFSEEPELRRRASVAAKKLTSEEERLLRVQEVQSAVSCREVAATRENPTAVADHAISHDDDDADGHDRGKRREAGSADVGQEGDALEPRPQTDRSGDRGTVRTMAAAADAGNVAESIGDKASAGGGRRAVSRVKAAPGVLAFLTREFSSRAAAATAGAAGEASVPLNNASNRRVWTSTGGRKETGRLAAAAGSLASATKAAAPKPMSKSLAALIARKAEGGGGDGGGRGGVASAGGIAATPLGFLEELKTRTARAELGGSRGKGAGVSVGDVAGGTGEGNSGGQGGLLLVLGGEGVTSENDRHGPVSFLEELKARRSRIS